MDLGAGTALNVLDFFLAADTGVVVVVPEPTSIENTYDFLLAAFLRSLRSVSREDGVREALDAGVEVAAPGLYSALQVQLPCRVDSAETKARFDTKQKVLKVIMPTV